MSKEAWIVEMHHPRFGWLDFGRRFGNRDAAELWADWHCSKVYPTRVRQVKEAP
jgi:hypothetical protein